MWRYGMSLWSSYTTRVGLAEEDPNTMKWGLRAVTFGFPLERR